MTDIVERIRPHPLTSGPVCFQDPNTLREAADELEAMRAAMRGIIRLVDDTAIGKDDALDCIKSTAEAALLYRQGASA